MDQTPHIVVHGRGNAWPVPLGESHPFYDQTGYRDLANASFSLVVSGGSTVSADILVDAGHGTIQSLLTGSNRIPDCICLTHGILDQTLAVDGVVQSNRLKFQGEKKYPVYASQPVFRLLVQSFPHLEELIEFREIRYGRKIKLDVSGEVQLTPFPAYHGEGAHGASMLLFETCGRKVLFTGDLFSPLLRGMDYNHLMDLDLVVADSNNRFPWPRTNHWSFAGDPGDPNWRSNSLEEFLKGMSYQDFIRPHIREDVPGGYPYFEELGTEWNIELQPFTILEFLKRIRAGKVALVHYSGTEDLKHYGEPQLSGGQLLKWAQGIARKSGTGSRILIPDVGDGLVP